MGVVLALWQVVVYVVQFWQRKFREWYTRKSPVELWLDLLRNAETFEEWEEAALHLDNLLGLDLWRNNPTSKYYDYRLINERLNSLVEAREEDNINQLVNLLRSGLVRNLGNISSPKLYNRAFAGTKYLIEEYITQVAEAVEDVSALPTTPPPHSLDHHASFVAASPSQCQGSTSSTQTGRNTTRNRPSTASGETTTSPTTLTNQTKLDFLHDTRQAFGRSTLVLQGGAIFGMCHLGVVKALFLRGLLPRIITGTATGALIAALVAIHTEEELPNVLRGEGIDLSAFAGKTEAQENRADAGDGSNNNNDNNNNEEGLTAARKKEQQQSFATRWQTLLRRARRFWKEGYFLDVKVLEDCVRANVGDLTFEEAFNRSKRVLNVTVATEGQGGVPTLLNYLTAPNVLIWTAAVASNGSSPSLYGRRVTTILCKDAQGNIVPWAPANIIDFRHWTHVSYSDRESPLSRIAELFNVNHFIVSQARPYLIPFLQSDMHGPSLLETGSRTTTSVTAFLVRMVGLELRHRLHQLDTLRMLPAGIRRFLVDERVPAASMTLVPEVTAGDFVRLLFETPTREALDYWILRGERSVWPAVAALRVRCAVENELDRSYQRVRRIKAGGLRRKGSTASSSGPAAVLDQKKQKRLGAA
ncbi:patatin-like phospholipase [Sodiomyces alkalinus F11]|uniref:Patatin-like phospholipase n=1 Tax=Sodiomyces alkalinus (strain CBS 110278 / VKM F-3762 / F11) TaxID=1314773 RepID=A0A3N2PQT5_SODAK|nr:patatin-like phospholipase [Sodiomyces alkalinus F11]ROT36872.1 patatin-like phospholipase [Sodiomyces alkalinus F11]